MSQADEGGKRGKKRKQRQAKPLLEQLPAVAAPAAAAAAGGQQQSPASSQQQQQPHQQAASLGTGNSKFARALGSTDYRTRQQGLQALSRWLLHRPAVSELDMMKLWKGIFFCFWHSDKEPVQVWLCGCGRLWWWCRARACTRRTRGAAAACARTLHASGHTQQPTHNHPAPTTG
jgi:hypothetical protein